MRSLFLNFLKPLCLLLFSVAIFAQPSEDVPIGNLGTIENEGEGTLPRFAFCLDENDDLIVKVNVVLGGLEVMGNPPNQYGVIPSTYHDMYVEFTVDGQVLDPVPVGNFDIVQLQNGFTAFSFIAQSPPINYSADCNVPAFLESYVVASIGYRLVTPGQEEGSYVVYPACEYAGDWDMFSCQVYSWAPWCDATVMGQGFAGPTDPVPTCYNEWFSGYYIAHMYCNCIFDDPDPGPTHDDTPISDGGGRIIGEDDDNGIKNRLDAESTLKVFPNPMGNALYINSNNESIKSVELYNAKGDVVIRNQYNSDEIRNVRLNTTELPNGLYLARIVTNVGIEVIKVLK